MELTKTLGGYLDDLASNSPTPGGGNVAALCGVLSSCLGTMVCNLTIGKKKYAEVEDEMKAVKEQFESYRAKFISLASEDNAAFDKVMDAFKMPRESETEKQLRAESIEKATLGAAEVPASVIKACSEVITLITTTAAKGNQNSLSDAGVAALLIASAAEGALLNVLINCSSLKDKTAAMEMLTQSEFLCTLTKETSRLIVDNIIQGLKS